MTWLATCTAEETALRNPRPGHITPLVIAWALSQLNQFNGHTLRPYSLAEHALLVSDIAERELQLDVHGQLAALLHDGHAFICGTLPTQCKRELGEAWRQWEKTLQADVIRAFALRPAFDENRQAIGLARSIALATVRRDLLPQTPTHWAALQGISPLARVRLNSPERRAVDWETWRDRFLDRLHALDEARNRALYGCTRHEPTPALIEELG